MTRTMLAAIALAALASCSPPAEKSAQNEATTTPNPDAVQPPGCNELDPQGAAVRLGPPPTAVAALDAQLLGGPLPPGIYDLVGGHVANGAPAWTDPREVALQISESDGGVLVNYVEEYAAAPTIRWTANFDQGPPARLTFTCGRASFADIAFATPNANTFTLRLPEESGAGAHVLEFRKRA